MRILRENSMQQLYRRIRLFEFFFYQVDVELFMGILRPTCDRRSASLCRGPTCSLAGCTDHKRTTVAPASRLRGGAERRRIAPVYSCSKPNLEVVHSPRTTCRWRLQPSASSVVAFRG